MRYRVTVYPDPLTKSDITVYEIEADSIEINNEAEDYAILYLLKKVGKAKEVIFVKEMSMIRECVEIGSIISETEVNRNNKKILTTTQNNSSNRNRKTHLSIIKDKDLQ